MKSVKNLYNFKWLNDTKMSKRNHVYTWWVRDLFAISLAQPEKESNIREKSYDFCDKIRSEIYDWFEFVLSNDFRNNSLYNHIIILLHFSFKSLIA